MKRKRGVFRMLAVEAKQRLVADFWADTNKQCENSIEMAQNNGHERVEVLNIFETKLRRRLVREVVDEQEEQLYLKISHLLKGNPNCNLLSQVLDRVLMERMTDTERERYVFTTSALVEKCKMRFFEEMRSAELISGG